MEGRNGVKEIFAERLKKYMKAKGVKGKELSRLTGGEVSEQQISSYTTGKNLPRLDSVCLISRALGVSVDSLLNNDISIISRRNLPNSYLLEELTVISDKLGFSVFCDEDKYHPKYGIIFDSDIPSASFEAEFRDAFVWDFFEAWKRLKDLFVHGHITEDEYHTLIKNKLSQNELIDLEVNDNAQHS